MDGVTWRKYELGMAVPEAAKGLGRNVERYCATDDFEVRGMEAMVQGIGVDLLYLGHRIKVEFFTTTMERIIASTPEIMNQVSTPITSAKVPASMSPMGMAKRVMLNESAMIRPKSSEGKLICSIAVRTP